MATGKERAEALANFDATLNAPLQGWDAMDRQLRQALQRT